MSFETARDAYIAALRSQIAAIDDPADSSNAVLFRELADAENAIATEFGAGGSITYSTHQVTASETAVDLRPAQVDRVGMLITNNSDRILYVKIGGTSDPSPTNFSLSFPPAEDGIALAYEVPSAFAAARIRAIWEAGATGQAQIVTAVKD